MRRLPLIYIDVPALRPGTPGGYALAVVSVGFATVLRLALDPYVEGVPFITLWPAVIITALISGFGAGLLCVALSTAAADFFVLSPRWAFHIESSADAVNLVLFALLTAFCVAIVSRMRVAIEREQAAHALQASRARLQLALDAARLGWWQYDPLHRVVSGDARFKEIFGVVDDEATLEEALKRVHPDDAERVSAVREAALNPVDPKPLEIEHRIQRGDGEVRWVKAHGLAYFEGAGRERRAVNFVGTVEDITERKDHEEREHLLMREVNHRAKNMLSVVDAIAQRLAASDPQNFAQRFSERIQALSANQDLLIRNEWKGVGIQDLVRAQLAHFTDLIGSRIAIQGPKLLLKGASAQAIGLALHELATNAGKYGALSTDSGRVDIRWSCDSGSLMMNWTERDGPPVSAPERRGFGTIVVKAMAERSLDGTVDLDYAPSGVTWRLCCPAPNALSAEIDQA
jgi:PAS domain S-box-containing protein